MCTSVTELQELREAQSPEPFKDSGGDDGLIIVANRGFGNNGPDQDTDGISRAGDQLQEHSPGLFEPTP